jgi:hypothetical protein
MSDLSSSDWTEAVDKATGKTYYVNSVTQETRWTKPGDTDTSADDEKKENWTSSLDKGTGKRYYFNVVTKETRWNKPACFGKDEEPISLEKRMTIVRNDEEDLGDPTKWKRVIDEDTGKAYYLNSETNQTSWKKPKGFDAANSKKNLTAAEQFAVSGIMLIDKDKKAINEEGSDDDGEDNSGDDGHIPTSLDDEKAGHLRKESGTGSSGSGSGTFRFSKHRKGLMNRILHLGDAHDEKTLLSFKKSMIKKALLKQNRDFDQEAIQSFKNIMSYMEDRKSSKADTGHVKKLIQNGLTAPESLRDEMFLQICKQVTNHPIQSHKTKGWQLMKMLLGSFPPSASMRPFLEEFFNRALNEESDKEVKALAEASLERIAKISELGPRIEIPSQQEIRKEQSGGMVSLKVYTLDQAFRIVEADCFTKVKEVKRSVYQQLKLIYSVPFALYEFSKENDEHMLDDEVRILDVVGSWERIAKEKNIAQLDPFRLVLKCELVLKVSDKNILEDEEAFNLLYAQAVWDIVNEKYPAVAKDCTSLAALNLQNSHGDYDSSTHTLTWISERIPDLMPQTVLYGPTQKQNAAALAEAAQKVITKYSKLTGISAKEAKLSFLDYLQDWPLYGAAFVTVEQKQLKEFPPFIKVAVNCDAILLVHPETNDILEIFSYHEIVTWGYSEEKFILVVGNLVQQRKLFFKTNRGKFLNKLVHDYVKTKVPAS